MCHLPLPHSSWMANIHRANVVKTKQAEKVNLTTPLSTRQLMCLGPIVIHSAQWCTACRPRSFQRTTSTFLRAADICSQESHSKWFCGRETNLGQAWREPTEVSKPEQGMWKQIITIVPLWMPFYCMTTFEKRLLLIHLLYTDGYVVEACQVW